MSRRRQDGKRPAGPPPASKRKIHGDKIEEDEDEEDGREVSRKRRSGAEGRGEGGSMSAVHQATLLANHLALEDSVDLDKVWPDLRTLFHQEQQQQIQAPDTNKARMKELVDLLVHKEDDAFHALVHALRPDYDWLADRLQRGAKDEQRRINRLGKGIRRKIAIAMLMARISERQKDVILDRVTSVVETEMTKKANRVNVPDHRAAAQLDHEHRMLRDIIRYEVDPLLYGEEPTSVRSDEDHGDILGSLRSKLEQLKTLQDCYTALNLGNNASPNLPSILLEKIEEVKLRIRTLQKEKQAAVEDSQRLSRTAQDQQRALSRLEQHSRNLELENKNLESERQWLERAARKHQEHEGELHKQHEKVKAENRDLLSEIQLARDKLFSLTLRNKSLDGHNSKLIRDNLKLSAANTTLRKQARNNGSHVIMEVKSENKRLASERLQIKKDMQRLETERRHLVIRSQKLESENRNLREQKSRLSKEKSRSLAENRALKTEAKRLALGKYSPLPPISEYSEREDADDVSDTSLSASVTSRGRQQPTRRMWSTESSTSQHGKSGTPWNKYKEDDTGRQQRRKGSTPGPEEEEEEEENEEDEDEDGERKHEQSRTRSKKHDYEEDEGRSLPSPRRAAAHK